MKVTDIRCAIIGENPVVRVCTDAGISGFGPVEYTKPYIKPHVAMLREAVIGADPTLVERAMIPLRPRGAFKPWGAAVSAIEIALWDIAGKAAGVPVHKLLGGKVRDRVRVYNGGIRTPMTRFEPEDFAAAVAAMKAAPHGFTLVKQQIGFHSPMRNAVPGFHLGERRTTPFHSWIDRGLLTERGMSHMVACVAAMKSVLGEEIGLALDCGPGMAVPDAIRFARAMERFNLVWLEDMITGDYSTHAGADLYAEVTRATATPTHTGEQIYLRQNFRELIERKAVRVIGPDPCDIGGLAELKFVAEHADLHGVLMAPHGIADGLLGIAALVQVCAALPDNYIAFELPAIRPGWWPEILTGVPEVQDGFIAVPDAPGLGVEFDIGRAQLHLSEADKGFFD
jgi:L-alanine-DL-glutamate epimerase-like enolase superfamily enzyme